jgi:hypothetical protein
MDPALVTPLPPTRSQASAPARARDGDADAFPQMLDQAAAEKPNISERTESDSSAPPRTNEQDTRVTAQSNGEAKPANAGPLEANTSTKLAEATGLNASPTKTDASDAEPEGTAKLASSADSMQGPIALQVVAAPAQVVPALQAAAAQAAASSTSAAPPQASKAAVGPGAAGATQQRAPIRPSVPQPSTDASQQSTAAARTPGYDDKAEPAVDAAIEAAAFPAELAALEAEITGETRPAAPRPQGAIPSPIHGKPELTSASAAASGRPTSDASAPKLSAPETAQPDAASVEPAKAEPQPVVQTQSATPRPPAGTEPGTQTQVASNAAQTRDVSIAPPHDAAGAAESASPSVASADAGQGASTSFAPRTAPSPAMQTASHILRRFDGRSSTFEVRLDPAELGRVDGRLEVGADRKVRATLAAERQTTLAELVRASRDLERALSDSGLDIADNGVTFNLADGGRNDFARSNDRDGRPTHSTSATAQSDTVEATTRRAATPVTLSRWSGARLDVWA